MDHEIFIPFLIRAKRQTYASGKAPAAGSRPNSHDLEYNEGNFKYIDSYLGGFHFIGEEAVWENRTAFWGMNYYGKTLVAKIPDGFGEFLKAALMCVPQEAPYRGPDHYAAGDFEYRCRSQGSLESFEGWEEILFYKTLVYRLIFHGGEIRE